MPSQPFGAGYFRKIVPENAHQGTAFSQVVVWSPGRVGIDIVDVARSNSRHFKCIRHRQKCPVAVFGCGGLVEGITAVSVARDIGKSPTPGIPFEHDKGRSLTQIESCASFVKRTAMLLVENHQRIESVEMEAAQGFRTAGNHNIRFVVTQHFGAKHHGIKCRGAGSGNRAATHPLQSCHTGHLHSAVSAVVAKRKIQQAVFIFHPLPIVLRQVHPSDSGPRNQHNPFPIKTRYSHLRESLLDCNGPHQRCPARQGRLLQTENPLHLAV